MTSFSDMLSDWFTPIIGGKKYEDFIKQSRTLQTVRIKNKKLATELEKACQKKDGFLTYSEFLDVEQFGENGYHATHKTHGFTSTYRHWSEAVFIYMQKYNLHTIIELGPGNGRLLQDITKLAKKNNFIFNWYGIEISDGFRKKISQENSKNVFFKGIFKQACMLPENVLQPLIFSSFCLDSIPPEMLINTSSRTTAPNNILGIRVTNGILQEFFMSEQEQRLKNMSIKNGVFTYNNLVFDFSSWHLTPMKRLYTHGKSLHILSSVLNAVKNAHLIIIDEMRESLENYKLSEHVLHPLLLGINNTHSFNAYKNYLRSGELLYYYPLFLPAILSFLKTTGFREVSYEIEIKKANEITGKKWGPKKTTKYLCFAVTASDKHSIQKLPVLIPTS